MDRERLGLSLTSNSIRLWLIVSLILVGIGIVLVLAGAGRRSAFEAQAQKAQNAALFHGGSLEEMGRTLDALGELPATMGRLERAAAAADRQKKFGIALIVLGGLAAVALMGMRSNRRRGYSDQELACEFDEITYDESQPAPEVNGSNGNGKLDLSKLRIPESHGSAKVPFVGGAVQAASGYGTNLSELPPRTGISAIQAEALNGLVVAQGNRNGAVAEVEDSRMSRRVTKVKMPPMYCPFCGNKLTLLPDGRHQCKRERRRGCGIILEDYSVDGSRRCCDECQHPLIKSDTQVTWVCHNCGARQSEGCGGLWEDSMVAGGVGV